MKGEGRRFWCLFVITHYVLVGRTRTALIFVRRYYSRLFFSLASKSTWYCARLTTAYARLTSTLFLEFVFTIVQGSYTRFNISLRGDHLPRIPTVLGWKCPIAGLALV